MRGSQEVLASSDSHHCRGLPSEWICDTIGIRVYLQCHLGRLSRMYQHTSSVACQVSSRSVVLDDVSTSCFFPNISLPPPWQPRLVQLVPTCATHAHVITKAAAQSRPGWCGFFSWLPVRDVCSSFLLTRGEPTPVCTEQIHALSTPPPRASCQPRRLVRQSGWFA